MPNMWLILMIRKNKKYMGAMPPFAPCGYGLVLEILKCYYSRLPIAKTILFTIK